MNSSIPLIISGAPRSGTSLLYNLFDGHSQVTWLVNEGFLFEYLEDLGPGGAELFVDAIPGDVTEIAAGLRDKQVIPPLHQAYRQSREQGTVSEVVIEVPWSEQRFLAALAAPRRPGVVGLWQWLVGACLAGLGQQPRRYACLKSPDFAKSGSAAIRNIGEVKALIIVRDPLHAIDSLKRSRELRGEKLLTWPQIALTIAEFRRMLARIEAAPKEALKWLRYEDLVARAEGTMRDVAAWLDIPFEPCLVEPTMCGQQWPGISSFSPTDGIDAEPAERRVQALTAHEVAVIETHLGAFRSTFGYR